MTREDIISMAREAGAGIGTSGRWLVTQEELERFAALVAAAEREACAKVVENLPPVGPMRQLERATLKDAAAAIHAKGQA